MNRKSIAAVLAVLTLSGCAGQPPADIPLTQPTDDLLSCDGLITEYHHVVSMANDRSGAAATTSSGNVYLGGTAVLMPPTLLFIDVYEADAAEARAYRRRANALAEKVEGKCGTQLARLEVGPDPYAEEARLAYERGEAASPY